MKKSNAKILIITDGNIDHASSRIRAIQFIPNLVNDNYQVTWVPRIPIKPVRFFERILFPMMKRMYFIKLRYLLLYKSWDIIFVQRYFIGVTLLKLIKRRNIKLIYDFDDAIYLTEKNKNNSSKTGRMVKFADIVIISTPYLEKFCSSYTKNIIILPTSVDGNIIKQIHTLNPDYYFTIGWIGSKWTTDYLKVAEEGLKMLTKFISFKLLLVGADKDYNPEGINVEHKSWSLENEQEYLKLMDIGIMPLPDTPYTQGKGGYKLYLYMAAGLPVVASPVGINMEIVKNNGYLATNATEWRDTLLKLLKDTKLRKQLGHEGRILFEQKYSSKSVYEAIAKIITDLT